ncbi:hypothetical protein ACODM8_15975 [Vibrio ostreicida]|uniref:hypothetical protein n=1 Tax=Vibrio ostreicida TaxID=526588 RepID=UPI003B5908EA
MFKNILITALGVLSLVGCTSHSINTDYERFKPSFFIQFQEHSSAINNVFALNKKIEHATLGYEKKPTVVLVAVGHSLEDYNLALSRLYSVSNVARQDVRVLVKPLDLPKQKDLVAVHVVSDWTSEAREAFESQEFSEISQLNRVYSGSDDRYFYRQPRARVLAFSDKALKEQLQELGKEIGWNISTDKLVDSTLSNVRLVKLQINTLEQIATSHEVTLIFDRIIDQWLSEYSYRIDARNKLIELLED